MPTRMMASIRKTMFPSNLDRLGPSHFIPQIGSLESGFFYFKSLIIIGTLVADHNNRNILELITYYEFNSHFGLLPTNKT